MGEPPVGFSYEVNGTKTVLTDNAGPVAIEVPRERDASFEPIFVGVTQHLTYGDLHADSMCAKP